MTAAQINVHRVTPDFLICPPRSRSTPRVPVAHTRTGSRSFDRALPSSITEKGMVSARLEDTRVELGEA